MNKNNKKTKVSRSTTSNYEQNTPELNYNNEFILLNKWFRPTQKQSQLIDKINKNDLIFVKGCAGTGKTMTVCFQAITMLWDKKIDKIILTKPIKESGESIGFLPGSIEEKINPYMQSYLECFHKLIGKPATDKLIQNKIIELKPVTYLRGITMENSLIVCDEAQNMEYEALILYITRLGKNSKMIIAGDVGQADISKAKVVFQTFIDLFIDIQGIAQHEFNREDIMRNKLLIDIVDRYEQWKELNQK
jgi:phosphate starvation-inducible PhoH-like protein